MCVLLAYAAGILDLGEQELNTLNVKTRQRLYLLSFVETPRNFLCQNMLRQETNGRLKLLGRCYKWGETDYQKHKRWVQK